MQSALIPSGSVCQAPKPLPAAQKCQASLDRCPSRPAQDHDAQRQDQKSHEGGGEIAASHHRKRRRQQPPPFDRLVSQAVNGEPTHNTAAPKVISNPAVRILTSSPADNSESIAAGAITEQPVTISPSINAVEAKLFFAPAL
jgi:hypothetical protein